jgi:hypothetical protein
MSWFLRGAAIGNSESMYNIGVRYALGQGVVRDDIEAFKWFELAADTGVGVRRRVAWGISLVCAVWFAYHQRKLRFCRRRPNGSSRDRSRLAASALFACGRDSRETHPAPLVRTAPARG